MALALDRSDNKMNSDLWWILVDRQQIALVQQDPAKCTALELDFALARCTRLLTGTKSRCDAAAGLPGTSASVIEIQSHKAAIFNIFKQLLGLKLFKANSCANSLPVLHANLEAGKDVQEIEDQIRTLNTSIAQNDLGRAFARVECSNTLKKLHTYGTTLRSRGVDVRRHACVSKDAATAEEKDWTRLKSIFKPECFTN
jgi:hypothetical protein